MNTLHVIRNVIIGIVIYKVAVRALAGTALGVEVSQRRDALWQKVPAGLRRILIRASRWLRVKWLEVRFQLLRSPLYLLRLMRWSPWGILFWAQHQWNFSMDKEGLRQLNALPPGDPRYSSDRKKHHEEMVRRFVCLALFYVVVLVITAVAWFSIDSLAGHIIMAVGVVIALSLFFGVLGKPDGEEIIEAADMPTGLRPVNKALVIEALTAYRPIKIDPERLGTISVRPEERGWQIQADLPLGIEANRVAADKGALVAAFGFPDGMVWPQPTPKGQPGNRLFLAITYEDISEVRQKRSPLIGRAATSFFDGFTIALDHMDKAITMTLLGINLAISALPGFGKTQTIIATCLGVAPDKRVRYWIADHKGDGDYLALDPLVEWMNIGSEEDEEASEQAVIRTVQMLKAARREVGRRFRIKREQFGGGPLTEEMANHPDLGLLVIVIDECQVPFRHPVYGPQALTELTAILEHNRAVGVVIILATQVPDKFSLPEQLMDRFTAAWAGEQAGHRGTEATLGTGTWARGFKPQFGMPGMGILKYRGRFFTGRTVFQTNKEVAEIVSQCTEMRGGPVAKRDFSEPEPSNVIALGAVGGDEGPWIDPVIEAISKVQLPGELNVWPAQLAERVADAFPGATAKNIRRILKDDHNLAVHQVWNRCYGSHVFQQGDRAGQRCDAATCEQHNKDGYSWAELQELVAKHLGVKEVA